MTFKKSLAMLLLIASTSAVALDNTAKEELAPPPAEGALSPEQIPLITTIGKPVPQAPAAAPNPSTAPQTGKPSAENYDNSVMPEEMMVLND